MNELLSNLFADFQKRLDDIANLSGINMELIALFRKNLNFLKNAAGETGKMAGLTQKIETQIGILEQIEKIPEFQDKYETLREQSVVLMVGAFEVFVTDIFKTIANEDPSFFTWPEKDKKIAIDIEMFKARFTLGDAFVSHLENKQYSFQDLGSIIKACHDYLGFEVEVDDKTKESIICATSYRHLIVHNNSIVDRQFLHQTRDIRPLKYKEGSKIVISKLEIEGMQASFLNFAEYVVSIVTQRDD